MKYLSIIWWIIMSLLALFIIGTYIFNSINGVQTEFYRWFITIFFAIFFIAGSFDRHKKLSK